MVRALRQHLAPPGGAALIPAIVLMAVVSILAAGVSWIGYASTARIQSIRDAGQAKYIADAMIDYARWILVSDKRGEAGGSALIDHLAEPWAIPIPHSRLQLLFGAEMSDSDNRAFGAAAIAGAIADEQGKYNLSTIFQSDFSDEQREDSVNKLMTFCRNLRLTESTITALIRAATSIQNRQKTSDVLKGFEVVSVPSAWHELQGWMRSFPDLSEDERSLLIKELTWLPVPSKLNINTASRNRIAMLFEDTNTELADLIVARRNQAPFRTPSELAGVTSTHLGGYQSQIDTRSDYFKVEGYAQFGQAEQSFVALLHRQGPQVRLIDQWIP